MRFSFERLKNKRDYLTVSMKDLRRINLSSLLMVLIGFIVFVIISSMSILYAYALDPLLGMSVFCFMLGVMVVCLLIMFVYGKIIYILREFAGEE